MRASPSRGLILEGGGGKGAYAFGCLLAFQKHGIRFEMVSGTSVGALNAALWATGNLDLGRRFWLDLSPWRVYRLGVGAMLAPLLLLASYLSRRHSAFVILSCVPGSAFACWLAAQYWRESGLSLGFVYVGLIGLLGGLLAIGGLIRMLNLSVLIPAPLLEAIDECAQSSFSVPTYAVISQYIKTLDPDHPTWASVPLPTPPGGGGSFIFRLDPQNCDLPNYVELQRHSSSERAAILMHSARLPYGIFPGASFDSLPVADGGLSDNLPLLPLVESGCREVIVIRLRPHCEGDDYYRRHWQHTNRLVRLKHMSVDKLVELAAQQFGHVSFSRAPDPIDPPVALPLIEPSQWPERIITIAPRQSLGSFLFGTLNFGGGYAKRLVEMGMRDAEATIANANLR